MTVEDVADYAECAACGYDLSGITGSVNWRCPECGERDVVNHWVTRSQMARLWLRGIRTELAIIAVTPPLIAILGGIGVIGGPMGALALQASQILFAFSGLGLIVMPIWLLMKGGDFVGPLKLGRGRNRLGSFGYAVVSLIVGVAIFCTSVVITLITALSLGAVV